MGKRRSGNQTNRETTAERRVLIAYYLTIAAFFASSFFPEARLWGINWWAYYPMWVRFTLLIAGAAAPYPIWRWTNKWSDPAKDISDRSYWLISLGLLVGFGLMFYLFRARTHLLGDGYQLLSTLSSEHLYIKFRNRGSVGLQYFIMNLLGGRSESNAVLSYQITSLGAGLLLVGTAIIVVRRLLKKNLERLLLVLMCSTGGVSLLFFGYVENYALFTVIVLVYGLTGLLVFRGLLNRWWLLAPQLLAVSLHIFGVVLLPATIYVLTADSRVGRWLAGIRKSAKWTLALGIVVIAGSAFAYFYATSYFLRFALVPLIADRFTIDGYTLLSLRHMLDMANLALMLAPSMIVLVFAARWSRSQLTGDRSAVFLLLAAAGAFGAVFLFDPKLGMPRDWDLFAFSGVPLALLLTWRLFVTCQNTGTRRFTAILCIALNLAILAPRLAVQIDPEKATSALQSYMALDIQKATPALYTLRQYYKNLGQTGVADSLSSMWSTSIQTTNVFVDADELVNKERYAEAMPLLRAVLERNPGMHQAWFDLAWCYQNAGRNDSALECLFIADGLNPYNAETQFNIGLTYYSLKNFTKAEQYFERCLGYDSSLTSARLWLALIYKNRGEIPTYLKSLQSVLSGPKPPREFYYELIDYYIGKQDWPAVLATIEEGLGKGLDTPYVESAMRRMPKSMRR